MGRNMRKHMFQMNPETGISFDYMNQLISLKIWFHEGGRDKVAEKLKQYPRQRYTERYPPSGYRDVVTDQNRSRVRGLDELADYINTTMTDPARFTDEEFRRVVNLGYRLVGKKEPYHDA